MTYLSRLSACLFLCVSLNTFAALSIRDLDDYWPNGGEGVYDDVLDITWLLTVPNDDLTWAEALTYAENYETTSGIDGWRLPSVGSPPMIWNESNLNEFGHMFFSNLGNSSHIEMGGQAPTYCYPNCLQNTRFIESSMGVETGFDGSGLQSFAYWFSEEDDTNTSRGFIYDMSYGLSRWEDKLNLNKVWLVHDGDVGLPIPDVATRKLPDQIYTAAPSLRFLGYASAIFENTLVLANAYGRVNVYKFSSSSWSQQSSQDISQYGGISHNIGEMDFDGDKLAVIGYGSSDGVWVYKYNNTGVPFPSVVRLASDEKVVSISVNNDFLAVGLEETDEQLARVKIYSYQSSDGSWVLNQTIISPSGSNTFGSELILEGNNLFISSYHDDGSLGAVYIYKSYSGFWWQEQKISNPDISQTQDSFGKSISLDNDLLVIGSEINQVFVYKNISNSWMLEQTIERPLIANVYGDGPSENFTGYTYFSSFGRYVFVSNGTIYVGSYQGDAQYAALIYRKRNQTWTPLLSPTIVRVPGNNLSQFGKGFIYNNELVIVDFKLGPQGPETFGPGGFYSYNINSIYLDDDDGDGFLNDIDVFPNDPTESIDTDDDGIGDNSDNCPDIANADQSNIDNDASGDVCDIDIDGDGINNVIDAFPNDSTESSDIDADNVGDNVDNCPTFANPDQSNIDSDANGDACDIDIDGDSIRNSIETAAGMNPNDPSDGDQAELSALEVLGINKQVPAMGGIGLLALGLSMLGLGAVSLRKK